VTLVGEERGGTEQTNDRIPEGWTWASLSQLTESVGNFDPRSEPDRGFGYVDISSVDNQSFTIAELRSFKGREAPSRARRPIQAGDVLFSNVRTYLRNIAIVPEDLDAQLCSTGFSVLHSNGAMEPRFLLYYTLTDAFVDLASSQQTGSSYPATTERAVREIPVAVPPLAEQRRIVAKVEELLARVSAARERLRHVPPIVKRFRQAVLASACSGQLTADWREAQSESQSGSSLLADILERRKMILDNVRRRQYRAPSLELRDDLPELPDQWVWASVECLSAKVVDGVHKTPVYVDRGIPFVTVRNLTAGPGISFQQLSYISQEDHEKFIERANPEPGDILLSKDGTLGVVRAVRTEQPFSIFVSVAMIKPVLREMTDYLEMALSSPLVQRQMVGTGSGLQHIHLRDLRADCVPLPSLAEQGETVRRVEALFRLADAIEERVAAATARAEKLTQAILAKAFRGELVPTESELARREGRDYEPASALLARIHRE
jgi:type I restriction enzyme S subunit